MRQNYSPLSGNTACDGFLVSQAPPAAESIRCFPSYRPFLWLTWLTIMRFDSQVLRFLKHWHVSIVSLLSNNGDGLYRLCNMLYYIFPRDSLFSKVALVSNHYFWLPHWLVANIIRAMLFTLAEKYFCICKVACIIQFLWPIS